MAETLVDALLRQYAPTQAATAIALGAYLTLAEMINCYVPESDDGHVPSSGVRVTSSC